MGGRAVYIGRSPQFCPRMTRFGPGRGAKCHLTAVTEFPAAPDHAKRSLCWPRVACKGVPGGRRGASRAGKVTFGLGKFL
jgi:hypothetical protein